MKDSTLPQKKQAHLCETLEKLGNYKRLGRKVAETALGSEFLEVLDLSRDKLGTEELKSKMNRLATCANNIVLHYYTGNENPWRIHDATFCQQPDSCPVCAKRMQAKRIARFQAPIKKASQIYKHAYFLTLTVKNEADLRDSLDNLQAGLFSLRRKGQKNKNGTFRKGVWSSVSNEGAAICSIEIKRGKNSKKWHPHAHLILFSHTRIDTDKTIKVYKKNGRYFVAKAKDKDSDFEKSFFVDRFGRDWIESTGGKSCNTFIKKICVSGSRKSEKFVDNMFTQCMEIFKYNSKIFDNKTDLETGEIVPVAFSLNDLAQVAVAGFRRRKFITYGQFRDKQSPVYAGGDSWKPDPIPDNVLPKIYRSQWNYRNDSFHNPELVKSPQFHELAYSEIKKIRLGEQAKILGKFQRAKSEIFLSRGEYIANNNLQEMDKAITEALKTRNKELSELKEASKIATQVFLNDGRKNIYVEKVVANAYMMEDEISKNVRKFYGGCLAIDNFLSSGTIKFSESPPSMEYINFNHA